MKDVDATELQNELEDRVYNFIEKHPDEMLKAISGGLIEAEITSTYDEGDRLAKVVLASALDSRDPFLAFAPFSGPRNDMYVLPCHFGFEEGCDEVILNFCLNVSTGHTYFVTRETPQKVALPAVGKKPGLSTYRLIDGKLLR